MAPRERHKHSFLQWHFREESGLRQVASDTAYGLWEGIKWRRDAWNAHVGAALFTGIIPLAIGAIATDSNIDNLEHTYADTSIAHFALNNDTALTYSAYSETDGADPYVLVKDNGAVRVYTTDVGSRDTEWTLITNQSQALNIINRSIDDIDDAIEDLEQGRTSYLPSFASFSAVSALFDTNAGVHRASSPPDPSLGGVPQDLSDRFEAELSFWQEAYDVVENGHYGFAVDGAYLTADKAHDNAIPITFEDPFPNDDIKLTLSPNPADRPEYEFGATYKASAQFVAAGWVTLTLLSSLGNAGVAGAASTIGAMQRRRRRKQRDLNL